MDNRVAEDADIAPQIMFGMLAKSHFHDFDPCLSWIELSLCNNVLSS